MQALKLVLEGFIEASDRKEEGSALVSASVLRCSMA
jgi:hypothetical protein